MTQDEEHLRLLAIFHYIVAGLAALFSFFPLFYAALGFFMLHAPSSPKNPPPPAVVGWVFIAFGACGFLVGLTFSTCVAVAGRHLARHRRYWFVFIVACVECLFFPFGIILGVFTIIVLSRDPVKQLFGLAPRASL